jgi:hypothetical protein
MRSSQARSHQFARPDRCMTAGGDRAQDEGTEQGELANQLLAGEEKGADTQIIDCGHGDDDPASGCLAGDHCIAVVPGGGQFLADP